MESEDEDLNRSPWLYPGSHMKWGLLEKIGYKWPASIWVDVYLKKNKVIRSIEVGSGSSAYYYLTDPYRSLLPGDSGAPEKHVKAMFGFSDEEVLLIKAKSEQMTGDKAISLQYPFGLFQKLGLIPLSWGKKKYNVNDWLARIEYYEELPLPSDLDIFRKRIL